MALPVEANIGETVKLWDANAAPVTTDATPPVFIPPCSRGDRTVQVRWSWTVAPTALSMILQRSDDNVTFASLGNAITDIGGRGQVTVTCSGFLRLYMTTNTGPGTYLTVEVSLTDKLVSGKLDQEIQVCKTTPIAVIPKNGTVFLTTAGVLAETLALPFPADDGKILNIVAITAQAHTVTTPANGVNGASTIMTWAAAVGNGLQLVAYKGSWWTVGTPRGITIT